MVSLLRMSFRRILPLTALKSIFIKKIPNSLKESVSIVSMRTVSKKEQPEAKNIKEKLKMKARVPKNSGGAQNMNQMIRQAQKMQDQITELQEDIESREFTATAGGGAVEVTLSGKKEIKSLNLKPEIVDPEDIEMLQDLIISAINEAVNNIETTTESEMSKITGGVSIPGMF